MGDFWRRVRFWGIAFVVGAVVLVALALVALIVVASVPDPLALALSILAASIPALVYGALVLRLDRYEREPMRIVVACVAWGAVGAILFSLVGGIVFQALVEDALGVDVAGVATVVIGAPIIEESFKGIAVLAMLVLARGEFDSTLDGLVYGALIGVGFAMTENILYFGQAFQDGGFRAFGVLVIGRALLGGLGHPSYTAVTGAAIGWARGRYGQGFLRILAPILGWVIAVGLHLAWNAGLIYTSARLGDGAPLLEVIAIQSLVVIVPAALVLYAIARISARHELAILREELRDEVARGTITEGEYRTIVDNALRQRSLAAAAALGGRTLRQRQQAFFDTAAELAFRSRHRRRGERFRAEATTFDERDRARLTALRAELGAAGVATAEG